LLELGRLFSELLLPGGDLILSGLLDDQAKRVVDAYQPWFRFNETVKKEEWIRLDGQRLDD